MTAGGSSVGDLLGMHTKAGTLAVTAFATTFVLCAVTAHPVHRLGVMALVWVAVCVAAVALVRLPGDTLSVGWTCYMVVLGPAVAAVTFAEIDVPVDPMMQLWPITALTGVYTYLCVRGRTGAAWIGFAGVLAAATVWGELTGQGPVAGLALVAIDTAPLVMSTFFAWTIRPAARNIYELRRERTLRVAQEAADSAVLEERDRQLSRLDVLARPLLERLADPEPLTADDRAASALLEAQLRDSLRARILSTPDVVAAARGARSRSVEVVLLDDHGLDGAPAPQIEQVTRRAVEALDGASTGVVTVRVLPPGRPAAMTVVHSAGAYITRREYDAAGRPLR